MASTKVLTIGSVIKHRGAYNDETTYYTGNQVTMHNSVFQAIGNNFHGIPPTNIKSDGTIELVNTAVWQCIVDNTTLYNIAINLSDEKAVALTEKLATETEERKTADKQLSTQITEEKDVLTFNGMVFALKIIDKFPTSSGHVSFNMNTKTFVYCATDISGNIAYYSIWDEWSVYMNNKEPYANKIYINTATNDFFRWDGSTLVNANKSVSEKVQALKDQSVYLTMAEYEALAEKDPNKTYYIYEE